jgi:hypothetical protein
VLCICNTRARVKSGVKLCVILGVFLCDSSSSLHAETSLASLGLNEADELPTGSLSEYNKVFKCQHHKK